MSNQNVIRNLKDFHAVANKLFKCGVKRIDEIHSQGHMGVKLIVGQKLNPIYDPLADPTKPELSKEERIVEQAKTVKQVADIRIVWVRPGMNADELTKEYLLGIKKSLEKKTPVIDSQITTIGMGKQEKSDNDIAKDIESGKEGEAETSEFDDDTDEIGFDEESVEDQEIEGEEEVDGVKVNEVTPENDKLLNAINTLNGNINTLANDISDINKRLNKVEKKKKK